MKILTGVITSTKMAKTATVSVTRFISHPIYKKRIKRTEKYQVHDENGHKVGEMVNFVPCAPVSKLKRWKIVEKADVSAKPTKTVSEAKPMKEIKKAVKKTTKKPVAVKKAVNKKS